MSIKILPIHNPCLHFSPVETDLFATIKIDDETIPWILQNFMGIYVMRHWSNVANRDIMVSNMMIHQFESYTQILENCPFITNRIYDAVTVEELIDIVEFIKKLIDKNNYIVCYVDSSMIDQYSITFPHPIFVYGYDDEKNMFYTADFFAETYKKKLVTYDQMQAAIRSMRNKSDLLGDYIKGLNAWCTKGIKNYYMGGGIDRYNVMRIINREIESYLNSNKPHGIFKRDFCAVGIEYYNYIIDTKVDIENIRICIKSLSCLLEHYKVILHCIMYLESKTIAGISEINRANDLCLKLKKLINKCIMISKKRREINEMGEVIKELIECKSMETALLNSIMYKTSCYK